MFDGCVYSVAPRTRFPFGHTWLMRALLTYWWYASQLDMAESGRGFFPTTGIYPGACARERITRMVFLLAMYYC